MIKIVEKDSFIVMGVSKVFKYDSATIEIPQFCTEHYKTGKGKFVCGMYGVCIDESMGSDEFEYLIADNYNPSIEIPNGFVTKIIPKHTWGFFAYKGPIPKLQQVTILKCTPIRLIIRKVIKMKTTTAKFGFLLRKNNYVKGKRKRINA